LDDQAIAAAAVRFVRIGDIDGSARKSFPADAFETENGWSGSGEKFEEADLRFPIPFQSLDRSQFAPGSHHFVEAICLFDCQVRLTISTECR
jgi:hypothetical protein